MPNCLPFLVFFIALSFICPAQDQTKWVDPVESAIRVHVAADTNFSLELPQAANSSFLSAGEFGLSATNSPENNVLAVQKAIDACKVQGVSTLRIPPGRYRLGRFEAPSKNPISDLSAVNHYSGRIFQLKMIGLKDFTIDGQGAEFIFGDLKEIPQGKNRLGAYFLVKDCQRVLIKNLTVDWERSSSPLACFGKIVKVDLATRSVTYEMQGGPFPHGISISLMREWDCQTGSRAPEAFHFALAQLEEYHVVSGQCVCFTFTNKRDIRDAKVGDWGLFKLKNRYTPVGFSLDSDANLTIDNVNVYGVPENAVWSRQNKFLQIINSHIMPRPGTEPVYSCNGAMEIHNSLGGFRLENCEISYALDDVLHYSDFFMAGSVERLGDYSLKIGSQSFFQTGDCYKQGSRLLFHKRNFEPLCFSAEIVESQWTFDNSGPGRHYVTVTTRDKLPAKISPDTILFNDTFGVGRFVIRNNKIRNCSCHGLYVCMPNGIIEGNCIERTAYPALCVHSVVRWGRWPMGYPPHDVIVRGNVIRNCNTALRPPADLFVGAGYDSDGIYKSTDYPAVHDVIFENNRIEGSARQAIAAWSCRNVLFLGNTLINPNRYPGIEGQPGAVFVSRAENIFFSKNSLEKRSGSKEIPISIDSTAAKNISLESNAGF
ncbi:MAG: right-handed parallel beta-helix repeat-containing protein [Verrucomicrobiota bacterium]